MTKKLSVVDRVKLLGYRVKTNDGRSFEVYEDDGYNFIYYGTFSKEGLEEEFFSYHVEDYRS